jgi:hypothetical protein
VINGFTYIARSAVWGEIILAQGSHRKFDDPSVPEVVVTSLEESIPSSSAECHFRLLLSQKPQEALNSLVAEER